MSARRVVCATAVAALFSAACVRIFDYPTGPADRPTTGEARSLDSVTHDRARAEARAPDARLRDGPRSDLRRDTRPPDQSKPDAPPAPLFLDEFVGGTAGNTWALWRLQFAIASGQLTVQPAARVGFNYGHSGNGRGAQASVHAGNTSWRNYRLTLDAESTGVSSSFDPHGMIPGMVGCYRGFTVLFRIDKDSESWNSPANTLYGVEIQTRSCPTGCPTSATCFSELGKWIIGRRNGYWYPGTGWSSVHEGQEFSLKSGTSSAIKDGPNHVVIEVTGQTTISVWVNNVLVDKVTDTQVKTTDGGVTYGPLTHGGIGVQWGWESLGWVDNVRVDPL